MIDHILRSPADLDPKDIHNLYESFDAPIAELDCGKKCASHNPSGKPFCCDICHAVPAAYNSEWKYLNANTNLWHPWRGDECVSAQDPQADLRRLRKETPQGMILLACLGPDRCQRPYRALSCRQFPFFPYVSSDYRFLGLACEWEFERVCWVISNLGKVSMNYRRQFIQTFDKLFTSFQDEFDGYALHSEQMRGYYSKQKRRFPLLHRNGWTYLVSPASERQRRVDPGRLATFGYYR